MFGKKQRKDKEKRPKRGGALESVKTVVYALAIALFIRTFLVQAFRIPSGSMEDTLLVGDFLLVDKVTYGATVPFTNFRLPGFRGPRKGDILVFKEWNANRDYIKRCVAVEGDTLEVKNNEVHINGTAVEEPYRSTKRGSARAIRDYGPVRIPDGTIFMMGDNRNNSADSREGHHGPLDLDRVVGRAFVIYWSSSPPRWLQRMSDNWLAGLLQLVVGKPRLTRIGKWLARDYTDYYGPQGLSGNVVSRGGGVVGAAQAAENGEPGVAGDTD